MTLAFLGDISLNDAYVWAAENGKEPFRNIGEHLAGFDEVVGNLECMCAGNRGENVLKSPRMKTTVKALSYLNDINLSVAMLANNHIYDNLDDGFLNTTHFLENHGIKTVGAGQSLKEASKPVFLQSKDITICLLNYVHQNTNPKPPEGSELVLNYFETEKVIREIKHYKKQSDHVIVSPHWGGDFECGSYPNPIQSEQARRFIDAGASAVIGHHSHTLQPIEEHNGKPIIHSLGNFCFADIEQFGHEVHNKLGKESVIAELEFTKTNIEIGFTPIINNNLEINIDHSGKVMKRVNRRNKRYESLKGNKKKFAFYANKHKYFDTFYFFFFGNNRYFFNRLKQINLNRIRYFFFRK